MYIIINLFIISYLLIAMYWTTTNRWILDIVIPPIDKYIVYSGLWHSWAMFTTPYKYNRSLFAQLTFDDGSISIITLFDIENGLFLDKIKNSKLEKIMENIINDTWDFGIRKFFCDFLYCEYSTNIKKVIIVELIVELETIPNFFSKEDESFIETKVYYTYRIPDDTITRSTQCMA